MHLIVDVQPTYIDIRLESNTFVPFNLAKLASVRCSSLVFSIQYEEMYDMHHSGLAVYKRG
jgi:hypothetical protein